MPLQLEYLAMYFVDERRIAAAIEPNLLTVSSKSGTSVASQGNAQGADAQAGQIEPVSVP